MQRTCDSSCAFRTQYELCPFLPTQTSGIQAAREERETVHELSKSVQVSTKDQELCVWKRIYAHTSPQCWRHGDKTSFRRNVVRGLQKYAFHFVVETFDGNARWGPSGKQKRTEFAYLCFPARVAIGNKRKCRGGRNCGENFKDNNRSFLWNFKFQNEERKI